MKKRQLKKRMPTIAVIGNLRSRDMSGATRNTAIREQDEGHLGGKTVRRPRVILIHGRGANLHPADLQISRKRIARSKLILVLQDVAVGVIMRAAKLAQKYRIRMMIDSTPKMDLTEKIRRAAEQIPDSVRTMKKKRHG